MTFFLCLAAALCAENMPVMFLLAAAALILSLRSERGHYYRICPYCGCYLDPGEACDCQKESRPGAANTETAEKKQPSNQTKPFRPYFTGVGEGCQG